DSGRAATGRCDSSEQARHGIAADARFALLAQADRAVTADAFDRADIARRALRPRLPALIVRLAATQRAYERAIGRSRIAGVQRDARGSQLQVSSGAAVGGECARQSRIQRCSNRSELISGIRKSRAAA